ncbi:MAG: hypothetical protein JNK00_00785 [Flavipsychrobacter sp.]|nr:hypothetical protein [Flavipsychrobacter sp.]
MHVSITDSNEPFYSAGFAVRFFKSDGTDWVGNFKEGWGKLRTVIELPDSNNLFVIACGICYVMNPNETTPIDTFGVGFNNLLFIPNRGLVLYDDNCLEVLYNNGTRAPISSNYWDGIKDVVIDGNILKGTTCDYTDVWTPFEYNIDTNELKTIGGVWHYPNNVKPKFCWKFWK